MNIQNALKTLQSKVPELTQKDIAKAIGRSQANVSYLLNVKAANARPSASVVQGVKSLMKKYGVTENDVKVFAYASNADALKATA